VRLAAVWAGVEVLEEGFVVVAAVAACWAGRRRGSKAVAHATWLTVEGTQDDVEDVSRMATGLYLGT
jgi:hypothetical protein